VKAAVRDAYGGPGVVRIDDIPTPSPKRGEVLVRVRAASVNRADLDNLHPRWLVSRLWLGPRQPRSRQLGFDLAGVVDQVGEGVTRFKPGDRVFTDLFAAGFSAGGSFAEFVAAGESAFQPIPDSLSDANAAALPHAGVLALQSLRRRDGHKLEAGQRLLVVGASGNVGPYAVQIGKARGAHVTGVARGSKLDFVRALGTDEVIDYETTDYTNPTKRYDWIVDVDAHHPLRGWRRALTPGGIYVADGGSFGWLVSSLFETPAIRLASGKRMSMMLWWKPFNGPDVAELLDLVESGKVMPAVDRTFPLERVGEALDWVDSGRARGKVLISV
jgi:NADPH:quinone reductase-like Zn-dependent oxidoreductase